MQRKSDKIEADAAAKVCAEAEAPKERQACIQESEAPLAYRQLMKVDYFDPVERARAKARSRAQDDEDLRLGKITREELQRRNGGHGIFKNSKISHRPRYGRFNKPE